MVKTAKASKVVEKDYKAMYERLEAELVQAQKDRLALEVAIEERDEALEVAENNMAAAQDVISHLAESNNKLVSLMEAMAAMLGKAKS